MLPRRLNAQVCPENSPKLEKMLTFTKIPSINTYRILPHVNAHPISLLKYSIFVSLDASQL